ncbi:MAG: gliding motility-associated C-terminal domain-containing protein, partial [Bacteroidetes bacterium]
DDYFRGFTIWRRINSDQMPLDTCSPGLEGRGYTQLNNRPIRDFNSSGRYTFLDQSVERGRTYCYRVLAVFARRTAVDSFFYNSIESLASSEACVQLGRDLPLLVKVDVTNTDANTGSIEVCWTKPNAVDLDTVLNAGPYVYELQRAAGQTEDPSLFQTIMTSTAPTFAAANDTCFLDTNINTFNGPYTYRVNFYVNGESQPLGEAIPAASVFLNVSPTDRTNILSWDEFVPWENFVYTIFRENDSGGRDSLTTVVDPIYRDEGLVNGQEYCYVVRSSGTYNINGLPSPLLNHSQRVCAIPVDNVPPCPPKLNVTNLCDEGGNCDEVTNLENHLSWVSPAELCPEFEDVAGYRIYYAASVDAELSLIATIDDANILDFVHRPEGGIAGCYAVTAIDTVSVANESALSNRVCVDNCPFYELPNAFTPNNDGQNDLFRPLRSCFIASVEFQVYNRWGGLVFETTDPNLNWDGTNASGDPLAEGTYFYRCQVFENRVEGVVTAPELLSGYIELLRGGD